jgi:hypothetical protein
MKLRDLFTRKYVVIGSSALIVALVVGGFLFLRRPPRVPMERYAPAEALAFVEVNSLTDLVGGLTHTRAWLELGPVLGLSSQLGQLGFMADLIGRSGLGPDEAVVAGRAQFALAVTGVESNAGETEEGAYIHLKPRFALIIETHLTPETATRLVRDRASIVAQRIYGESADEESEDYRGARLSVFRGSEPGRQLLAAASGSVVLIANHPDAIKSCLDSISGNTASLAEDSALRQARGGVESDSSVFGYVTASGIQKLVELSPLLFAGGSPQAETANSISDLVEHLSNQAIRGLLYSAKFEAGGVTERYLTLLRPEVSEALSEPLKPALAPTFETLAFVPRELETLTILNVERAGELPERVFKRVSPTVDIVAGVALREFVINLRKQYGLEPSDSAGDAVGSEIAIVKFGDDQPRAMVMTVNDESKLKEAVARYLRRKGAALANEQYDGSEIMVSSSGDRRAAAFVGTVLVLGTRDQIIRSIETHAARNGLDGDDRLKQIITSRPANASIISYRPGVEGAAKLLLGISKLTRVTDGSQELLDHDSARRALDRLPPSGSYTEFRGNGVFVETRSAVGNFGLLASLTGE